MNLNMKLNRISDEGLFNRKVFNDKHINCKQIYDEYKIKIKNSSSISIGRNMSKVIVWWLIHKYHILTISLIKVGIVSISNIVSPISSGVIAMVIYELIMGIFFLSC